MRIFSSGAYLRRVAAFTVRTKDLVSSLRLSAASVLLAADWDTSEGRKTREFAREIGGGVSSWTDGRVSKERSRRVPARY